MGSEVQEYEFGEGQALSFIHAYRTADAQTRTELSKQLNHLRKQDSIAWWFRLLGHLTATFIVVFVILQGVGLINGGHTAAGTVLIGVDIASVASIFIFGRRSGKLQ